MLTRLTKFCWPTTRPTTYDTLKTPLLKKVKSNFDNMPEDHWFIILSFLDPKSIALLFRAHKNLHRMFANKNEIPAIFALNWCKSVSATYQFSADMVKTRALVTPEEKYTHELQRAFPTFPIEHIKTICDLDFDLLLRNSAIDQINNYLEVISYLLKIKRRDYPYATHCGVIWGGIISAYVGTFTLCCTMGCGGCPTTVGLGVTFGICGAGTGGTVAITKICDHSDPEITKLNEASKILDDIDKTLNLRRQYLKSDKQQSIDNAIEHLVQLGIFKNATRLTLPEVKRQTPTLSNNTHSFN